MAPLVGVEMQAKVCGAEGTLPSHASDYEDVGTDMRIQLMCTCYKYIIRDRPCASFESLATEFTGHSWPQYIYPQKYTFQHPEKPTCIAFDPNRD